MTGLFCSFADVNIFDRFDTMAIVWGAAILPDIDHTKSIIGWASRPLSTWLQTKYGHRTVTHSIFFYLAVVLLIKAVDNLFHLPFTLPVALALGSHLIFDMCTKQGIPLMYPFSRRPFVLPANPKLRLSVNDFRSEAIVFLVFCCLNVFSYPLMAQGFWTRYNRGFATYDHLERETKHKPGDYAVMLLSIADNDTTVGILVEQKPTELILWREKEKRFQRFETDNYKLMNFLKRNRSRHEVKTINLLQVSADSLNTYMSKPVVKVTAQSEQELYYFEGPIMKKGNDLSVDYPNAARFQQLAIDNAQTQYELETLELHYRSEQLRYTTKLQELEQHCQALAHHTASVAETDYEEGKRREKVREITARIAGFEKPEPVNVELYRVQKAMLAHKLKETAHLNAALLIWQAKGNEN
ncbi:hypothetical protein GCM10028774_13260 [Spirosoma jeollabukense]